MKALTAVALLAAVACAPVVVKQQHATGSIDSRSRLEPAAPTKPRASRSHVRRQLAPVVPINTHLWDVTAYCATGHKTASGRWPVVGMAATLSRRIPFGTRLRVPGFGVVTVTDRIGHGSELDLYMGSGPACDRAARQWGRRHLTVVEVSS
jgi:3D (Asp-Asp-Asp) domain-containing protein